MIEEVDKGLRNWIDTVVPGATVVLDAPQNRADRELVHLYLLEIQSGVPVRREHPRSVELVLSYLVTVAAADAGAAHRILDKLLAAALVRADYQVELRACDPAFWAAFGIPPRPAFVLKYPLALARPQQISRVRQPAEINLTPVITLSGTLVTKEDLPVPYARVELPELPAATYTDVDGRFQFGAVKPGTGPRSFKIIAKGVELLVSQSTPANQPIKLRFEPKEI